jgi:hypothetical protein
MANQTETMQAVVARLRQEGAAALLDFFELHVAIGELVFAAQSLSAAVREIAEESAQLASTPGLASLGRLRALADYARTTSSTAEAQSVALGEIKRGLDGWNAH